MQDNTPEVYDFTLITKKEDAAELIDLAAVIEDNLKLKVGNKGKVQSGVEKKSQKVSSIISKKQAEYNMAVNGLADPTITDPEVIQDLTRKKVKFGNDLEELGFDVEDSGPKAFLEKQLMTGRVKADLKEVQSFIAGMTARKTQLEQQP